MRAGVMSPAPSGQGMDGTASVLSRVELRRVAYFGMLPQEGY